MTQTPAPLVSSPLAVVADVATRLVAPEPLEARLSASLTLLRDALGATSCAVWQHASSGMIRRAVAGDEGTATPSISVNELHDAETMQFLVPRQFGCDEAGNR